MLCADQYSLDVLPSNPVNNNHYVYLSGINGSVSIVGNEWYLFFYLYLNDKFVLPANTLNVNINLPFMTISSLSLSQIKNFEVPSYVIDSSTCDCYQLSYTINTNQIDYFNQKLVNQPINFDFNFNINEEALNNAKLPNAQTDIDTLINEFDTLTSTFSIDYTNYINVDSSTNVSIPCEYQIYDNQTSVTSSNTITCQNNENTSGLTTPLENLSNIEMDENFTINGYQIDFYYAVGDSEIKTLSYENKEAIYCNKSYSFTYPYETVYDESKKEVINTIGDDLGFYINDTASGYYVITAIILTSTGWFTVKITNNFDFIANPSYQIKLNVTHFLINDLKYFKEIKI